MKFIIIANSLTISKEEIKDIVGEAKIIALDGIANHLLNINIIPYAVVGDFDSIFAETLVNLKKLDVILRRINDQNSTDLDKGISFCKQNGATEIVIINAFGGTRLDHSLMNYRLLKRHYSKQCRIKIKEQQSYLELFANSTLIISGIPKSNLALLAAPLAATTSQGLEYDMDNHTLEFGLSESTSNSLKAEQATIKIVGSAYLIYELNCKIQTI
ncbi:thiamine diphosphokinase [Candidatus Jidaibacter acanthamoebae]|nr:thiamine diphosphokinase [Candidatus Jidaibacter acanthamoeba]